MSSQGAAGSGIKTTGFDIAKKANVSQGYNVNNISGVYVAEVMNDADNQHNGRITVKIPELGSTSELKRAITCMLFKSETSMTLSE